MAVVEQCGARLVTALESMTDFIVTELQCFQCRSNSID